MPVIQKIEITNFLNIERGAPGVWVPRWPHQLFDLGGRNSALNIPNGYGKSSMVMAVLAMLVGDRKALREVCDYTFAPKQGNHFTHARIQVLVAGGADLLSAMDGEAGGEPMVFGMYGNGGENGEVKFYSYQGRLEDCPVAHKNGFDHTFVDNATFLAQLDRATKLFPSNRQERTDSAWRDHTQTLFDISSLQQQFKYQKLRGAEGGHGYFDVSEWAGMDYSASVFYERLAPELLVNVMGELGDEGEDNIIDTIRIKTSKLVVQRHNSAEMAKRLVLSGNTVDELKGLVDARAGLSEAERGYDQYRKLLSVEYETLKYVVLDKPIPGIPLPPDESMPIARAMVLQDGKWFIPDRVMAEFTGEPASHVNQRSQERNSLVLEKLERSQVIDFACDSSSAVRKSGPAGSLYSRENALTLLGLTINFTRSWTKEAAIEAVTRAFDCVETHSDANPARAVRKNLAAELDGAESNLETLKEEYEERGREWSTLIDQQKNIGEAQTAYRQMLDSGLFSEEELGDPAKTGQQVTAAAAAASGAVKAHQERMYRLNETHKGLLSFQQECSDTLPGSVADNLQAVQTEADAAAKTAKSRLDEARGKRPSAQKDHEKAKSARQKAENRLQEFSTTAPYATRFAEVFGNESPVGLADRLRSKLNKMEKRKNEINIERGKFATSLDGLRKFRAKHGDIAPSAWLETCQADWNTHIEHIKALEGERNENSIRRSGLDREAVVAGRVAREAAAVAGGNHVRLHAAIKGMQLDQSTQERALTLFSALLHGPVYETADEAQDAAARLDAAGIEAPVFLRGELESFCRDGAISMEGVRARSWLVGIRTRQVECLLDPALVEREKQALDEEIRRLDSEIGRVKEEGVPYPPDGEDADMARAAAKAIVGEYEAKDAALASELATIEGDLPSLESKTTQEMLGVILAAERHQKNFSGISESDLQEQLKACETNEVLKLALLEEIEADISACEEDFDKKQSAMKDANTAALQIGQLRKLQDYIDHPEDNPAFMLSAPGILKNLEGVSADAEKRTRFQFDLAAEFREKGGNDYVLQVEALIQEHAERRKHIHEVLLPETNSRIEGLRKSINEYASKERKIDYLAQQLTKAYRAYAQWKDDFVPVAVELVLQTSLGSQTIGIHSAQTDDERTDMLLQMADEIEFESSTKQDMEKAKSHYHELKNSFISAITLALAKPNLDISDHVRAELEMAKKEPAIVDGIYRTTKLNHERALAANNIAMEHLESEWNEISEWLTNFTKSLKTNLALMKKVFAPKIEEGTGKILKPGFIIEGKVEEGNDIKAIMEEVIAIIEKSKLKELNEINLGVLTKSEEAKNNSRLDQKIREKFYPRVIRDVRIKLCMPSVAKRPLQLERKMVSTGQGIAMALMWIVRMAEFATKRWQNEQTTSQAQRKRVTHTQFTFIDGAFSSLSDEHLIKDALDSIDATKGSFQLIITDHDPDYQNNFDYFPTLIVGKKLENGFMLADRVSKKQIEPTRPGAIGTMSMRLVVKNGVPLSGA